MTEEELVGWIAALPGVVVVTASEEGGAPEVAWGDSFFYVDPDGTDDRRKPFATIVTGDYPGFDTASDLDRPGVYRLNVAAGRRGFAALLGFPPEEAADHAGKFDFTATDVLLPHPVYGAQGWVSVLVPGARTGDRVRTLVADARDRAEARLRSPH